MLETERNVFRDYLATQELKITRERMALFDEIFQHHKHFDAEELLMLMKRKHRKISRATVYRTLELLVSSGLVSRQKFAGDEYLYEHIHPGQHHDHLICLHCGKILEFESEQIERIQDEVCKRLGFHPTAHTHRIEGCCKDCFHRPKEEMEKLRRENPPAKSAELRRMSSRGHIGSKPTRPDSAAKQGGRHGRG